MQLFEMQGLLAGKRLPGDMFTGESLSEYFLRQFNQRDELARQVSALQTSQDNIINGLGIKGDGPVSKLVIEYVLGLVAENAYLLPKAASELSNAWLLHRTMMGAQAALKCLERGDYSAAREWLEGTTDEAQLEIPDGLATGELQKWFDENLIGLISHSQALEIIKAETPATDAAIDEIKAQGVDEYANATIAIGEDERNLDIIYAGNQAKLFSANLRAGRKG